MTLVMITIGWVIVLPMLVIGGLSLASRVLGARARRHGAIDVTSLARDFAALAESQRRSPSSESAVEREPVGSGY